MVKLLHLLGGRLEGTQAHVNKTSTVHTGFVGHRDRYLHLALVAGLHGGALLGGERATAFRPPWRAS